MLYGKVRRWYLHCNATCSMVKYEDDTSLRGCVTHEDETGYRNLLSLLISVRIIFWSWIKTKNQKEIEPVVINGVELVIVTEHKYLYINNQFNWNINTHKLCSKANQWIYFLRKLKLFNIDRDIMTVLPECHTICCYVLWYCMAKWSDCIRNLTKLNRGSLNLLVRLLGLMLTM